MAEDKELQRFVYQQLMQRELEQDNMLWQTPTLALTGQAFLLTIALNDGIGWPERVVAGVVGIVVSLISMQLMAKHRFLAEVDRDKMSELEDELGIPRLSRRDWPGAKHGGLKSHLVWMVGLWVFVGVNAIAILLSIVEALV